MFTEAKLFGLNGIIMHSRSPCATPNVRVGLDRSRWLTTTVDDRQHRTRRELPPPLCALVVLLPLHCYTSAKRRTTRGYPSEFSTKHITCDFFCYVLLLLNCALRCAKNDNVLLLLATLLLLALWFLASYKG